MSIAIYHSGMMYSQYEGSRYRPETPARQRNDGNLPQRVTEVPEDATGLLLAALPEALQLETAAGTALVDARYNGAVELLPTILSPQNEETSEPIVFPAPKRRAQAATTSPGEEQRVEPSAVPTAAATTVVASPIVFESSGFGFVLSPNTNNAPNPSFPSLSTGASASMSSSLGHPSEATRSPGRTLRDGSIASSTVRSPCTEALKEGGCVIFTDDFVLAHPTAQISQLIQRYGKRSSQVVPSETTTPTAAAPPTRPPTPPRRTTRSRSSDSETRSPIDVEEYLQKAKAEYVPLFQRRDSGLLYGRSTYHQHAPEAAPQ